MPTRSRIHVGMRPQRTETDSLLARANPKPHIGKSHKLAAHCLCLLTALGHEAALREQEKPLLVAIANDRGTMLKGSKYIT